MKRPRPAKAPSTDQETASGSIRSSRCFQFRYRIRPPGSRAAFVPAAGCLRPAKRHRLCQRPCAGRRAAPTVRSMASRNTSASRAAHLSQCRGGAWRGRRRAFRTSCASISTTPPRARCIPITRSATRCSKARFRPRRPICISASRAPDQTIEMQVMAAVPGSGLTVKHETFTPSYKISPVSGYSPALSAGDFRFVPGQTGGSAQGG